MKSRSDVDFLRGQVDIAVIGTESIRVLDEDGLHARRDLRVLARDGWVLVIGLILFGAAGFFLFWDSFPRGWRGVGRFGLLLLLVLFAGGIAGPMITRALTRRR